MRRPNGWGFASPKAKTSHDEEEDSPLHHHIVGGGDSDSDSDGDEEENHSDSSDQELLHRRRQRRRSFGDAEDILYYESFSIESNTALPAPGDDIQSTSKGLHHRNTGATSASSNSNSNSNARKNPRRNGAGTPQTPRQAVGYEFYQTPTPKRKPLHPGYSYLRRHSDYHSQQQQQQQQHAWRRPSALKAALVLGFGCYLILLVKSSVWLRNTEEDDGHRRAHADLYAKWIQSSSQFGTGRMADMSFSKTITTHNNDWNHGAVGLKRTSRAAMEQRSAQRRERTRPPQTATPFNDSHSATMWYPIPRMETRPPSNLPPLPPTMSSASLDQICGFTAQQASLNHPQHYPAETALGKSARVLITGILNPLGFQLAMHLYHRCDVQVVGGVDSMFPNTVQNRFHLVEERLELLHTTIPKMVKPIGLSFLGLDPKLNQDKAEAGGGGGGGGRWSDYLAWNPTHIVHVAGYSPDVYSDAAVDPRWRNTNSPYLRQKDTGQTQQSPLYSLRSSMVAMEQLLESVAQVPEVVRPHVLYVSSSSSSDDSPTFSTTKLIDEILAETHGVPSIAMRLPNTLYGPWGQAGAMVHDLLEDSARTWGINRAAALDGLPSDGGKRLDMMHVDDAVEAIVATMQYQTAHTMAVDVTAGGTPTTVRAVAAMVQSFRPGLANGTTVASPSRELQEGKAAITAHPALAEWHPRISLRQGLLETMAWHLHRLAPFGPAPVETADNFLKRHGQAPCEASNWQCHKGKRFLPCLSECNVRDRCIPSVFDEIKELTYNVTEGCNIVLYTQALGYNVSDLELHAEYMDEPDLKADEELVCNFAFVPRDSALVNSVTQKVPNEQLAKFGIKPQVTDSGKDMRERTLDGLNGRLLYRGWILLWVRNGVHELSQADRNLLKLSPGKLFHPDVGRALFMEENFSVSPTLEDVFFLVGQMKRRPFPKRTLKKDIRFTSPMGKELVKRQKFRLPPEPRRRAAILFAPLRIPNNPRDSAVRRNKNRDKKLSIHDAAKFMRYEVAMKDPDKEHPMARRQREFYEKVPSYINRNSELRSTEEPWYRYAMRHWVRSRWVVHDTHLEESRLLRCDWYQEHLEWGTELDQLSFAHVMATRELKRRIAHNEPDDHVKTFIEQHPHLKDLTDSYEWHPMETDANQLYREPVQWTSALPDHVTVEEEAAVEGDDDEHNPAAEEENPQEPSPLYVRIMSERVMAAARKIWAKTRQNDVKPNKRKRRQQ